MWVRATPANYRPAEIAMGYQWRYAEVVYAGSYGTAESYGTGPSGNGDTVFRTTLRAWLCCCCCCVLTRHAPPRCVAVYPWCHGSSLDLLITSDAAC